MIKLRNWKAPELLAQSAPVHTYVMQIAVDAGVIAAAGLGGQRRRAGKSAAIVR